MTFRGPKLIVATLAAAALFWPSTAESPATAAASGIPQSVGVTIEHQLIRVPVPPAARAPRRHVVPPANRLASTKSGPQRPGSLVQRAGRMLLGDGRYRPEPFPRPGR